MKTNKKDVVVTVPVEIDRKERFLRAIKAEGISDRDMAKTMRLLMDAYSELIEENQGTRFPSLRLCGPRDEVNRQGHPTRAPMRPGAGTVSSSKKEAAIK